MAEIDLFSENQPAINWFEKWFNHPLYLEVYSHRDSTEAAHCIRTILSISTLDLHKPQSLSVFDIACGAGRHALEFSRLGYQVTGNDLAPFLLEKAQQAAKKQYLPLKLTCCDMREITSENKYDLVVQLFTSFGYFESREDDQLVLAKAYQALKVNGWYVLDLINPTHLQKHLVAHSCRTMGNLTINEERTLQGDQIIKTIHIEQKNGESITFRESVRLYEEHDIREMLRKEGFMVSTITGNYQGAAFKSNESPRMMIFCQKQQ